MISENDWSMIGRFDGLVFGKKIKIMESREC